MASKKISELTAANTATGDDLLVLVDSPASGATTKKITVADFFASVQNAASFSNTVSVTGAATFALTANVGANVQLSTTTLLIGNSTANATLTSSQLQVANSTNTVTVNPQSVSIGTTIANTTHVYVGNSTVNGYMTTNSTGATVYVANATSNVTLTPGMLNLANGSLTIGYQTTPASNTSVPSGYSDGAMWTDLSYIYVVTDSGTKIKRVAISHY